MMQSKKSMMGHDLFNENEQNIKLAGNAILLPKFALTFETQLLYEIQKIIEESPLRHMKTPNGYYMSVSMTNCGQMGWITDQNGYRYSIEDPLTKKSWPKMPVLFLDLAKAAAESAGFSNFNPEVCLINQYEPGAKLSLHQDKDELDLTSPIVSISLGISATFLFGGLKRTSPINYIPLVHGDVVVWGGLSRLVYHGILPVKAGAHSLFGTKRINLTFRKYSLATYESRC